MPRRISRRISLSWQSRMNSTPSSPNFLETAERFSAMQSTNFFTMCCTSNNAVSLVPNIHEYERKVPVQPVHEVKGGGKVVPLRGEALSPTTKKMDEEVAQVNSVNNTPRRKSTQDSDDLTDSQILVDEKDPNPFKRVTGRRSRENSGEFT